MSKSLRGSRFGIILNRFDGFLDHQCFYPQLWGWLKGVVYVERGNRLVGGVLGSFSIDLMGLWTIEFFYPQLWGWLKGVVFVDRRNRFVGGVLGSFLIDLMGFWTFAFFSPPTLGVAAGCSFHLWPVK